MVFNRLFFDKFDVAWKELRKVQKCRWMKMIIATLRSENYRKVNKFAVTWMYFHFSWHFWWSLIFNYTALVIFLKSDLDRTAQFFYWVESDSEENFNQHSGYCDFINESIVGYPRWLTIVLQLQEEVRNQQPWASDDEMNLVRHCVVTRCSKVAWYIVMDAVSENESIKEKSGLWTDDFCTYLSLYLCIYFLLLNFQNE